jgi:hypothetical protein
MPLIVIQRSVITLGAPPPSINGNYLGHNLEGLPIYLSTALDLPLESRLATPADVIGTSLHTARCEAIDRETQASIDAGVTFMGHVFDADDAAQRHVTGTVVTAQVAIGLGQAFQTEWITKHNAIVTLTAEQLFALGIALASHVSNYKLEGRRRKNAVAQTMISEYNGGTSAT